uniref:Uncharacterized protein n=1 Tax=Thermosporothrix sp. COM3 TaxID=2490863 RepID=A0A455SQ10_9CHLR|nr:hypothetical protein KTC_38600 [Thermosporothrix sp. COM3]
MKKRNLLSRLRTNGWLYLVSALILLLLTPLYQLLVLNPAGFDDTRLVGRMDAYFLWIQQHTLHFLIYRGLLFLAFALLFTFPYSLYRIIVAQELMRQLEEGEEQESEKPQEEDEHQAEGMPSFAWRGKGFAVLAAWLGTIGILIFLLGTLIGTIYVTLTAQNFHGSTIAGGTIQFTNIFTITTNAVAIGILALSSLFFGAMIARSGRTLWPTSWLLFGYCGLAVSAPLSGSAVGVACSPATGQSPLTTYAILFFAAWILWFSIMLVRLRAEE